MVIAAFVHLRQNADVQPLSSPLPIRHHLFQQVVKVVAVILFFQVAQFVNDDVFDGHLRNGDQLGI